MESWPLLFLRGHLFLEQADALWLIDTGSPASFGVQKSIAIGGKSFVLPQNYGRLTAAVISQFVGVQCAGLLGVNILNQFDVIFDIPSEEIKISSENIALDGVAIGVELWMGIPVISVDICGLNRRMVLDTGAQVSYFQGREFASFPSAGRVVDFHPSVGVFEADTRGVEMTLAGVKVVLRCGVLPGALASMLVDADAHGIVGNEVLVGRAVAYCPRRGLLVLSL